MHPPQDSKSGQEPVADSAGAGTGATSTLEAYRLDNVPAGSTHDAVEDLCRGVLPDGAGSNEPRSGVF